jgi:hypothetical protein
MSKEDEDDPEKEESRTIILIIIPTFTTVTQNPTTYKSRIPLAVHCCNPSKQ